jgi:hypothetical protein
MLVKRCWGQQNMISSISSGTCLTEVVHWLALDVDSDGRVGSQRSDCLVLFEAPDHHQTSPHPHPLSYPLLTSLILIGDDVVVPHGASARYSPMNSASALPLQLEAFWDAPQAPMPCQ